MLIREITLENFGLFRGRNRIPLAPRIKYRQQRPVVLIGGQNGSGKTTILEALRLCLYMARCRWARELVVRSMRAICVIEFTDRWIYRYCRRPRR
ncbi:MAG: AAA family ATPase [Planctomycetes bacterium]|nr:AAA family ATPase [Planctomycetota bacterium]